MKTRTGFEKTAQRVLVLGGLTVVAMLATAGCPSNVVPDGTGAKVRPTVTAPADRTVECDGSGNEAALTAWLNSATFTNGCGGATLRNDFHALSQDCGATGAVTVTWTATDSCGSTASDSAKFTIADTTAPALTVPQPISVTCPVLITQTVLADWLASATATDDCGAVTLITERSTPPGNCAATITWTAMDDCGNAVSKASTYSISGDTTDPAMTLNGGTAITVECGAAWEDPSVTISDDCDALIRSTVTGEVDLHTPGVYVIAYAGIDACGNAAATLTRTVTVVDTTPPVVTLKTPMQLWPPNHQMQALTLADLATVTDACEGDLDVNVVGTILDIYSDEPDNTQGDGNTSGDIVIANGHAFSVRVERMGSGNGRVYGVRFEVTDSSGNTVEATAFVHVPHDQSGGTVVNDGAASGWLNVANP